MLELAGGHPAWKHGLIVRWAASLGKKKVFSQMKTLLQVNICSVSAWFLSIIDLLMQNTQLFEKPECAIIMQRASGHLCVLVWPWQRSVPGLVPRWILLSRAEERDTNTEPEGFSNAGFGSCYSRAVINAGTATGAPYHTVHWTTGVKPCLVMRGGSGGGSVFEECWTEDGLKKKEKSNKFWRQNEKMRARRSSEI